MRRTKYKVERAIIGIDLSLNGTGICCSTLIHGIKHQQNGYCFYEVIPKNKERYPRWFTIRAAIQKFYVGCTPTPKIFIEGYSFMSRSRSVVDLAEIGGIIRMDLHDHGLHFTEIPPTVLKKFITGKGNVKKDLILKEIYRRWGMDLDSHNLADAYALVKLGEAVLGLNQDVLTKNQKTVVSKLKVPNDKQTHSKKLPKSQIYKIEIASRN